MSLRDVFWTWLSPRAVFELPSDVPRATRWGREDGELPPEFRQEATNASLLLLHPLVHRRYWAAYRQATGSEQ